MVLGKVVASNRIGLSVIQAEGGGDRDMQHPWAGWQLWRVRRKEEALLQWEELGCSTWSGQVKLDYAQSLQSSAQIQSRSNGRSDELILLTHAHWAGGKDSTQCNREVVIPQRNLKLEVLGKEMGCCPPKTHKRLQTLLLFISVCFIKI